MKRGFEKYNKGIEKDIFILECINADIINRKANGDLYHDRGYIGITMERSEERRVGKECRL